MDSNFYIGYILNKCFAVREALINAIAVSGPIDFLLKVFILWKFFILPLVHFYKQEWRHTLKQIYTVCPTGTRPIENQMLRTALIVLCMRLYSISMFALLP